MSRIDIDAFAYKGNNGVQETSQGFATPKTDEEVQDRGSKISCAQEYKQKHCLGIEAIPAVGE